MPGAYITYYVLEMRTLSNLSCHVTIRLHKHAQDWRQHLACQQKGGTDFLVCGCHSAARV